MIASKRTLKKLQVFTDWQGALRCVVLNLKSLLLWNRNYPFPNISSKRWQSYLPWALPWFSLLMALSGFCCIPFSFLLKAYPKKKKSRMEIQLRLKSNILWKTKAKVHKKSGKEKFYGYYFVRLGIKKAASEETAFGSIRLAGLFFQIHRLFHQLNGPWHVR